MSDAFGVLAPAYAKSGIGAGGDLRVGGNEVADLVIARTPFELGGRRGSAVTINGTVPGPILRFREGETVTLRVTNRLDEDTSIHWHGILLPSDMDGVPGVSFPGIRPGETFTYRYRVRQNGTYWYHSHSALQEQLWGTMARSSSTRPAPTRCLTIASTSSCCRTGPSWTRTARSGS